MRNRQLLRQRLAPAVWLTVALTVSFAAHFSSASVAEPAVTAAIAPILSPVSSIRVRLLHDQRFATISGFGLRINGIESAATNLPIHQNIKIEFKNRRWLITSVAGRSALAAQALAISGDMIAINGQMQPPGRFKVYGSGAGIDLIAVMRIADYMKGVLPSEMPLSWPLAALEAQAVASHSYVSAEAYAHRNDNFDVDSSVESQVFRWRTYTHLSDHAADKLARVLKTVGNQILIDSKGSPYLAYFHSDCGGVTELARNVWGNANSSNSKVKNGATPHLVYDRYCQFNRHNRWHLFLSWQEIARAVRSKAIGADVRSVKIAERSPSGRAAKLAFKTAASKTLFMTGQDFRAAVGFSRLKSTLFRIHETARGAEFDGRGFGHGVGLCQHGARFMAMTGSSYRQILSRYYSQARLIDAVPALTPVAKADDVIATRQRFAQQF